MRGPLVGLWFWLCVCAPAFAEKKIALVVGNGNYFKIERLQKSHADAHAYATVLREKGFLVLEGYDLTFAGLNAAVDRFARSVGSGDMAVFVYSGHGWSDGAQNYLLSIDAPASMGGDALPRLSTPIRNGANGILDRIERGGASLRVAIIDSCSDNPFPPALGRRGLVNSSGIAPMAPPPAGTFIAFSASAGQSALDRLNKADSDPNSVFSRVFIPLLRADFSLQDAARLSQSKVRELSLSVGVEQEPAFWDEVAGPARLARKCRLAF